MEHVLAALTPFESSVILKGSKTHTEHIARHHQFESSVILKGSKTVLNHIPNCHGLRVV